MSELSKLAIIQWKPEGDTNSHASEFRATLWWGGNEAKSENAGPVKIAIEVLYSSRSSFEKFDEIKFLGVHEAMAFFANLKTSTSARSL